MTTKLRVSLAEFLGMPEEKPYRELFDGEVVEKAMPNDDHSELVAELIYLLKAFQRSHPYFRIRPELRHIDRKTGWIYLPDIAVTLSSRLGEESSNPEEVAPDFAIEVLSPDDRPGMLTSRIAAYFRAGTSLLWLIDPDRQVVTVFQHGQDPVQAQREMTLSASPALSGFEVNLAELFAVLRRA